MNLTPFEVSLLPTTEKPIITYSDPNREIYSINGVPVVERKWIGCGVESVIHCKTPDGAPFIIQALIDSNPEHGSVRQVGIVFKTKKGWRTVAHLSPETGIVDKVDGYEDDVMERADIVGANLLSALRDSVGRKFLETTNNYATICGLHFEAMMAGELPSHYPLESLLDEYNNFRRVYTACVSGQPYSLEELRRAERYSSMLNPEMIDVLFRSSQSSVPEKQYRREAWLKDSRVDIVHRAGALGIPLDIIGDMIMRQKYESKKNWLNSRPDELDTVLGWRIASSTAERLAPIVNTLLFPTDLAQPGDEDEYYGRYQDALEKRRWHRGNDLPEGLFVHSREFSMPGAHRFVRISWVQAAIETWIAQKLTGYSLSGHNFHGTILDNLGPVIQQAARIWYERRLQQESAYEV